MNQLNTNTYPDDSHHAVALDAWQYQRGISDEERPQRLEEIRPGMDDLWKAYHSGRQVSVRYSERMRDCYLLKYVPAYRSMASHVIEQTLPTDLAKRTLKVGFVGAGPAPEAVALIDVLLRRKTRCEEIEIHLFDVAIQAWHSSLNALYEVGCRRRWPGTLTRFDHSEFDLTSADCFEQVAGAIAGLDYMLFQNCLNETISFSEDTVVRNLKSLDRLLPAGATVAVADQLGYKTNRAIVKLWPDSQLRESPEGGFRIKDKQMPPDLKEHFFREHQEGWSWDKRNLKIFWIHHLVQKALA